MLRLEDDETDRTGQNQGRRWFGSRKGVDSGALASTQSKPLLRLYRSTWTCASDIIAQVEELGQQGVTLILQILPKGGLYAAGALLDQLHDYMGNYCCLVC